MAANSGEFMDFNELLHALDSEGTEETPVQIELGEDSSFTLSRKPKKRQVSSFIGWARCFVVYAHYLVFHQPQRSTDLLAYLSTFSPHAMQSTISQHVWHMM